MRSLELMNPEKAEQQLLEISNDKQLISTYTNYWKSITPENSNEVFRRYVFSFLSVHTPWSANLRSFLALDRQPYNYYHNKEVLAERIAETRAGNQLTKSRGISEFARKFRNDPNAFIFMPGDNHVEKRNAIVSSLYGLGNAKVSFALEMCHPLDAQVVCLDTHMLQLYGYTDGPRRARAGSDPVMYARMEEHWVNFCNELRIPPVIARAIWWDKKQQQPDSKYWTYAIEPINQRRAAVTGTQGI